MKKQNAIGLIIIGGFILFIIVGLVLLNIFEPKFDNIKIVDDPRIYETFEDFEFLDEYIIAENQYNDKKIKGYNITQQMNVTIEYDGAQAYLVAYIFENDKDCRDYASDVSGNDYDFTTKSTHRYDPSSLWYNHKTTWWFKTTHKGQYLAFSGNVAYYVKSSASGKKFKNLIEFINFQLPKQFEIKMIEEKI